MHFLITSFTTCLASPHENLASQIKLQQNIQHFVIQPLTYFPLLFLQVQHRQRVQEIFQTVSTAFINLMHFLFMDMLLAVFQYLNSL